MSHTSLNTKGIRAVALFEAAKSILLLAVGFGLLSLINRDVEVAAESLVRHLHLNPVHKFPKIFLEASRHVTNTQLWLFAGLAMFDALARGAVAYGLWYDKVWGKWLGVITAGIYIPLEIYEIARHVTGLKIATLVTNIAIVIYLGLELYWDKQAKQQADHGTTAGAAQRVSAGESVDRLC